MKQIYYLFILCLFVFVGFSQEKQQNLTHYVFPEFTEGIVLMKNGVLNEALLNYNALTEEMIFENNGVKLAVALVDNIDTIYIRGRKFFPLKGKFVELLYHSKFDLYAEYKCNLKDPGKPSGYGTSSQLGAATTYSTFFSGNRVYDMKLPEAYETNPFTIFWLKKENEVIKFTSIRQLLKASENKSGQLKKYIKDHKVSINDHESLIGLLKILESD
jgi:hypothetical protein